MYEISKTFTFDAAHSLPHLPESHKCHRLHGHTYSVTFYLRAPDLDEDSFVVDYGDLKLIKIFIDDFVDHRNLNDVLQTFGKARALALNQEYDAAFAKGYRTSAENIARFFYEKYISVYPNLWAVKVCETPNTSATFCGRQ